MDENQNVAAENAVETTTQTSSPQVEVDSTVPQTTQQQATDVENTQLPDANEEQRRAFQEMRLENKRLKEELEGRAKHESAFDAFRIQPTQNLGVQIGNYQDPMTGEVNLEAYNRAIMQGSQQAAQVAAQQTVSELLDEQKARTSHPELFSDPDIEQEIADRWVAARLRGENKTISDITDSVARKYGKVSSKVEKQAMERVLEQVTEKEAASLSASTQTSSGARQVAAQEDLEALRVQTRYGKIDATTTRMSSIPWANK